jgi:class 3 adenylate cyclase
MRADCYVVAGGLMMQDEEGFAVVDTESSRSNQDAVNVLQFALDVLQVVRRGGAGVTGQMAQMHSITRSRMLATWFALMQAQRTPMPGTGQPVKVRIGIHSGPITSGVVGYRMPKFCEWMMMHF